MRLQVLIFTLFLSCAQLPGQGVFSKVALPPMPAQLEFAGERVPLEYFDVYESMQREISVTLFMHSRTIQTLLNSKRYFAIIEPIMEQYGVPSDFKYLCMAESGLNPNAVSSAGAAGLWQIMPATGREFGLLVDNTNGLDERFHIEKSTEAACKYLLNSYRRFGSWTLAAAAYNAGDGGVNRRMTAQGVDDYYDLYLPEETMRYVFRILSLKLLTEQPYAYGYVITADEYYKPLDDYRTVDVSDRKIDWSQVARDNGTTYKMLRQLNHWIRDYEYNNASGRTFKLKVPNAGFRTDPAGR
ncbi:MAG: lytic transglycosylase domain-containing protein [Alistipes sp.]|nr:lytic transglycosylase domain-containing protein [Alistipes sp.]